MAQEMGRTGIQVNGSQVENLQMKNPQLTQALHKCGMKGHHVCRIQVNGTHGKAPQEKGAQMKGAQMKGVQGKSVRGKSVQGKSVQGKGFQMEE